MRLLLDQPRNDLIVESPLPDDLCSLRDMSSLEPKPRLSLDSLSWIDSSPDVLLFQSTRSMTAVATGHTIQLKTSIAKASAPVPPITRPLGSVGMLEGWLPLVVWVARPPASRPRRMPSSRSLMESAGRAAAGEKRCSNQIGYSDIG